MIFLTSSDSKLELVKPARLEVGDTIAFCAPSGFLDSSRMSLAKVNRKGFHIVYDDSFPKLGIFSWKDIIRANELMTYFEDKSVKAIFLAQAGTAPLEYYHFLIITVINDNQKFLSASVI